MTNTMPKMNFGSVTPDSLPKGDEQRANDPVSIRPFTQPVSARRAPGLPPSAKLRLQEVQDIKRLQNHQAAVLRDRIIGL
jgi:hypothetical protein